MKRHKIIAILICGIMLISGCSGKSKVDSQTSSTNTGMADFYSISLDDSFTRNYVSGGIQYYSSESNIIVQAMESKNTDVVSSYGLSLDFTLEDYMDMSIPQYQENGYEILSDGIATTKGGTPYIEAKVDDYYMLIAYNKSGDSNNGSVWETALGGLYSDVDSYKDSILKYVDTIVIGNRSNGVESAKSSTPYYEIAVDSNLTRQYIDGGMLFYNETYDYYLNVFDYKYSDYSSLNEDTTIDEYVQFCLDDIETMDNIEIIDTTLKTTDGGNYYLQAKQTLDDGKETYICMVYNQSVDAFWETWFFCDYDQKDNLQPTFNQLADTITII